MPSKSLNRLIWVVMAALLVVLAIKTRDRLAEYFASVGTLDVRADADNKTVYLRWRGKVEAPMANRIAEAFDRYKSDAGTFVLSLSSPGGSLDQGADVVRLLRRIRETKTLVTNVEEGAICASMCVPVYLQGERRIAAPDAEFMFHEVNFRDFFSNKADASVPDAAISRETDRFFDKYFEAAGVSPVWLGNVRAAIARGNEVWVTGRQLVDEKSGVVQQLM
ncbi:MAG: peptidase [Hyphomicrobium sp.]|uniref:peptidase n=1 Tax=Hyphomicrobium sp. TaxID=82 RepID=UPI0039E3715D